MHNPIQSKYPYASLTESITRLVEIKQQEGENLLDYIKRFKQVRDVFKSHTGASITDKFVEHTEEYKKETDPTKWAGIKTASQDRWMSYMLMKNSDQKKYGSLLQGLASQYSMGNEQYPATMMIASDVLTNHRWDKQEKKPNNNKSNGNDKDKEKEKEKATETSLAQKEKFTPICFCC